MALYLGSTKVAGQAIASGGATSVNWTEIVGKPTTFTPVLSSPAVRGGAKTGNGLKMVGEYLTIWDGVGIKTNATTYALDVDRPTIDTWYAPLTHSHTFASVTSKPTTLAGYGITDGAPSSEIARIENTVLDGLSLWSGTQAEYDAITTKVTTTIYFITG